MDPAQEAIRYLELRLAECRTRPELHRHQIPAYEQELERFRAGESSDLFAVTRAESMDRYANLAAIHTALQDQGKLASDRLNLEAAEKATSHADFHQLVGKAAEEGAVQMRAAQGAASRVRDLFTTLLDYGVQANPEAKQARRATFLATWKQLQQEDPDASWERLTNYPPYRARIPFSDQQLALLQPWFMEVSS